MMKQVKVAITQGDLNGIGYEVMLKSLADKYLMGRCVPIIYGSPKVLAYYKKVLDLEHLPHNTIRHVSEAQYNVINVIDCNDAGVKVELGHASKQSGLAAYQALERVVNDVKSGLIDTLVTAPINKETIQSTEFNFGGHTEYFANRFDSKGAIKLMIYENLRIAIVTDHIPLGQVVASLSEEVVFNKIKILNEALQTNFGLLKPKIAVLGLNPHAGDSGLLGNEERTIIQPAIERAKVEGLLAMGPYAADGLFSSGSYHNFDAILAMYHDQGLAPFQALASQAGVNFTAGLPIVRTAPAHGTAYEIVGKGIAEEMSFKEAIYEAIEITEQRIHLQELKDGSLKPADKKQYRRYHRSKIE